MRVCFTSIFALDSERVRRLARTELSTNHSAERSRRDIEMKKLNTWPSVMILQKSFTNKRSPLILPNQMSFMHDTTIK